MGKNRKNYNPAITTSFKMEFPGLTVFNYFVQETELPGLSMAGIETPYQNNGTNVPSNRIDYDPLNINLVVDEDYENYDSIRLWMHECTRNPGKLNDLIKDFSLHILDSNKQSKLEVKFFGGYPIMMSAIPLQSNTQDPTPIFASVTFRYQYFDFFKPT